MCYVHFHTRPLANTRRDRSRGIRDEAAACEPEVVSRERTWPPRPVAQPSRATGRPFRTKYDITVSMSYRYPVLQ